MALPVNFFVSMKNRGRLSQAIAAPSWGCPSRSMRVPNPTSRRSATVPASSTPARIRASTWARLCRSRTMLSMLFRWRICDRSKPAGPPPMIATWVRIAVSTVA